MKKAYLKLKSAILKGAQLGSQFEFTININSNAHVFTRDLMYKEMTDIHFPLFNDTVVDFPYSFSFTCRIKDLSNNVVSPEQTIAFDVDENGKTVTSVFEFDPNNPENYPTIKLYWAAYPFSAIFEDLEEISKCLCKTANVYDNLPAPIQSSYDQFNQLILQDVYTEAQNMATDLQAGFNVYQANDVLCKNLKRLIRNLKRLQRKWNVSSLNPLYYANLEARFQTFYASYLSFKADLDLSGYKPCSPIDPSFKYEVLCDNYDKSLECACLYFQQIASFPPNVQTKVNDFGAAVEGFLGSLYQFFNDHSITRPNHDMSGPYPFCKYFTTIVSELKWICSNKGTVPFEPEKVFDLQDEWSVVIALLDELRSLAPGICDGNPSPPWAGDAQIQSGLIYLQSSGADGSDGVAEGIHLRWALRGELGEYHIPKGDLANEGNTYYSDFGYTKDDDYVKLYKVVYDDTVPVVIDLNSDTPFDVVSSLENRSWQFVITNTYGSQTIQNEVEFRFYDLMLYDSILIDPKTNPKGFLAAYNQFVEVEVKNRLLFAADIEVKSISGSSPTLRYETVCFEYPDSDGLEIASRVAVSAAASDVNQRIVAENIKFLRFEMTSGECGIISLETYYDFIHTRTFWTHVDDFGLSLTDTEVYTRLDDGTWPSSIDNNWPRYNDGTTLKKNNYQDRWTTTEGLKDAVTSYLDLSKTDLKAVENLESDDTHDNPNSKPVFPLSYLDALNLTALDFHVARMLGMGHIDYFNLNNDKYVYVAFYQTHPDLPNNRLAQLTDHLFMSLPTDNQDFRKPQTPTIAPIEYGLKGMDSAISERILKENGYTRFGQERFVAINREGYDYEIEFGDFFAYTTNFDRTQHTKPVFYGFEYCETGATDFVKPEITASADGYTDFDTTLTNVLESVPFAESSNPLFTHRESNEGYHEYALYGINWFSRASDVSTREGTDETLFDFDPIKPPLDAYAHYVQAEDLRLFTTLAEQTDLQARITGNPTGDNCWTRVTFNWNHLHNIAYTGATKIEFYYRESDPLLVEGKIKSVTPVFGEDAIWIATKSFKKTSSPDNTEIIPVIAPADESKFIGSNLNVEGEVFEVLQISQETDGPTLKVKLRSDIRSVTDSDNPGHLKPITISNRPNVNSYFLLTENLNDVSNWTKLDKTLSLVDFSNRTEDFVEPGGDIVTYNIGGIQGNAIVIEDPSTEPIDKLHKITFDTAVLNDHPEVNTEHMTWYKGIVRVPTNGGFMKGLKVERIESQNPLVIWALDTESASTTEPTAVQTDAANSVGVNLHPGYRVYLEPESNYDFDSTHLVPSNGDSKKITYLALRAIDDSVSPAIASEMTAPLALLGLNLREPKKPSEPVGPSYSTRPDTFGKASYTFDIDTTEVPFSIAVYRAHDTSLLEALYESETVEAIWNDLTILDPNDNQVQRFYELANAVLDDDPNHEGEWKEYDGYRFPEPDLAGLLTGSETFEEKKQKIQAAIYQMFVPVSEQPIIYDFANQGTNTSSETPSIRDKNGQLLNPGESGFNPFPYACKFTSTVDSMPYLRFTDYKLDGASQNLYFYMAIEITRELKMGEPSNILGPVRIINAFPAEAPFVKKVETVLANPHFATSSGVRFYLNPYLPDENIKAFQLYRTTNESLTVSINLMTDAGIYLADDVVVDYFDDLDFPPFEQDIFYRVVALREILNERDESEYIPSKASELVKAQVVDNVNPPAPEISHTIGSTTTSPDQLHNVVLSWDETCYKGKYYLYKMTDSGQWQLVDSFDYNDTLEYTYADLDKEDSDGDTIYHRFKVVAENTGGLLSLDEEILTI